MDRRPFCVTEPVTVTVYVTVGRERGPSTRFAHARPSWVCRVLHEHMLPDRHPIDDEDDA